MERPKRPSGVMASGQTRKHTRACSRGLLRANMKLYSLLRLLKLSIKPLELKGFMVKFLLTVRAERRNWQKGGGASTHDTSRNVEVLPPL